MNADRAMHCDGLGADPLPRYPEPIEVELTPLGFRLRHGSGSLGGGVWAARWKAEKAAEALRLGEPIPKRFLPDRRVSH